MVLWVAVGFLKVWFSSPVLHYLCLYAGLPEKVTVRQRKQSLQTKYIFIAVFFLLLNIKDSLYTPAHYNHYDSIQKSEKQTRNGFHTAGTLSRPLGPYPKSGQDKHKKQRWVRERSLKLTLRKKKSPSSLPSIQLSKEIGAVLSSLPCLPSKLLKLPSTVSASLAGKSCQSRLFLHHTPFGTRLLPGERERERKPR